MNKKNVPLKEVSVRDLFIDTESCIYEIPIYQRNYAWEMDEISTLIQDVYDSYKKDCSKVYYIGTLVSFDKGDRVFEIIDGQQRLTTIRIILSVIEEKIKNKLTYRARKKSDDTLKAMPEFDIDEKDYGIQNGFRYAQKAWEKIVSEDEKDKVRNYFMNNVHIIHYQVPKDIDLNHYFEIMNSRGEQLEKHEIVKANLLEKLEDSDKPLFNKIWEATGEMSIYVQQTFGKSNDKIFNNEPGNFRYDVFDDLLEYATENNEGKISINDILEPGKVEEKWNVTTDKEKNDSFQPIIDFPNFLLIVLKLTRMTEKDFEPGKFNLDDKELLNEFKKASFDKNKVKIFAYNLLKARYMLDNYIVHHSNEEDTIENNPWKLQILQKENRNMLLKNSFSDKEKQDRLVHLLSMFEVSFTARQRKNYLFYCLLFLMKEKMPTVESYLQFAENLADRYFGKVYLNSEKLNDINTPKPGTFDEMILKDNKLDESEIPMFDKSIFNDIYGDGTEKSKGVPLYVFNYMDYKIWILYSEKLRGEKTKEGDKARKEFFDTLGCGDFGLDVFRQFYFSRTRRSLEHFFPQANVVMVKDAPTEEQINCFGNYAMISSEANSTGSNWSPKEKVGRYLDSSKKINPIGVASLKFRIMMKMCRDNDENEWGFEQMKIHQEKMLEILYGGISNDKSIWGRCYKENA